ncbi:hypothetical protein GGQ63_002866 [Prosthecomicrobium pneumaticum]|uniref:Uncharacterized protein n=1 Tax=Prosthecomicrobium pneumaticum TaxID=81895 RepID=A0A7W9FNE1_9HYPH|nr:hypothetical protein [Prosthecomicrobium pneumaticum]
MSNQDTRAGIQHQVRNSANPPKVNSQNPAWKNEAIASAGGKKK